MLPKMLAIVQMSPNYLIRHLFKYENRKGVCLSHLVCFMLIKIVPFVN